MPALIDEAPFVGRDAELTALSDLLAGAVGGHGGIALIAGESGIGKTRLIEELAAAAGPTGTDVFWGRCHDGDGAPAFWPWVQILRSYVRNRAPELVLRELGDRASEVAALVPELQSLTRELSQPAPVPAAQERFRLFDAIATSLKSAADARPLLLIVDDLHWADPASLLLLDFLSQELTDTRLFVVGTYRDVELRRGDPLFTTLGSLTRRPQVTRMALAGLDVESVTRCIQAAIGAPPSADLAASVMEETEGNPLYVTQMARLLASEGATAGTRAVPLGLPPTLHEVISRRLDRLSTDCVAALSVAAVSGREFQLPVVASASGLDRDAVLNALEEAESTSIIKQAIGTSGYFRFSHALIRETLYEDLPRIRRARLHLRVAEAIESVYGLHGTGRVAELAAHYRLAVPVTTADKAVAYARQAGDAAATVFAWEEAISQWRWALDLADADDWPMRCELLLALGEAQNNVGDRDQAKDTFLLAADAARRLPVPAAGKAPDRARYLSRAALGYGGPGVVLGTLDQRQVGLLEEALAAVGLAEPDSESGARIGAKAPAWRDLSARLLARLALALFWTPRREQSLTLSREAVALARQSADPRALIAALHVRRYVLWGVEHQHERSGFAAEMVGLAEAVGDPELTLQALRWRVVDSLELGDIAEVDSAIERYARLAEDLRHPYYRWYASLFRATRALSTGQYEAGERLAREALAFGQRAGDPDAGMFFTMQILPARAQQGRAAELEQTVRDLAKRYPTMLAYRSRLAVLCLDLGREAEAREVFDEIALGTADPAAGDFARLARDGNWLITVLNLARACVSLGDQARAATLYRMLGPFAELNGVTGAAISSVGPTSYWLGRLAAQLGRGDEALTYYEAALGMAERMEAAPQVAIARCAFAALLLAGDPPAPEAKARALALLDQALATAQSLGMAPLEREIRQALAQDSNAGSETVHRAGAAQFPDGLTAREVEVLRLVAVGRSNREIAETLVLSVVTVQNHIANIYRKADIRNRAEAATYALHHGLNAPGPIAL